MAIYIKIYQQKNIFLFIPRSFYNPKMTTEEIRAASEALHCGILDHLKSKSSLPTVIAFKHANFNFLFRHRGCKSNDSGAIVLERDNFKRCHFPNSWYMTIDRIGDGVKIDFPVKVRLFMGWSPKIHSLTGGQLYNSHATGLKN